MKKNNIIDNWIEQYNDPQIKQKVKNNLKHQILDHLEEQKENLEEQKKETIEKIRKVRQGNMLEEAAENIGKWYEEQGDFFRIQEVLDDEVHILYSRYNMGVPEFIVDTLYESEWRRSEPCDGIPEKLQKRIEKLNQLLK